MNLYGKEVIKSIYSNRPTVALEKWRLGSQRPEGDDADWTIQLQFDDRVAYFHISFPPSSLSVFDIDTDTGEISDSPKREEHTVSMPSSSRRSH